MKQVQNQSSGWLKCMVCIWIGKYLCIMYIVVHTLVYRIDVYARLLILRKKFPLYGLILVCTFIDFEEKFPPARLFHPAHLLVLVLVFVVIINFLMVKSQLNWILVKWQCLVCRKDKENSETIKITIKMKD